MFIVKKANNHTLQAPLGAKGLDPPINGLGRWWAESYL